MTIVASVKVRDGLILGTDSMTQISAQTEEGPQLLKSYGNARKLFQVGDSPIGVMTYGLGNVGNRSIEGLVVDFNRTATAGASTVAEVAHGLYGFIKDLYDALYASIIAEQRPALGFYVAGYSAGQPFAEEFEFLLPRDDAPFAAREPEQFGASWRGIDVTFTRLYKGLDPRIIPWLREKGLTDEDVTELFAQLEIGVLYDGMPIQDAINFTVYILETTIGWTEFQVGSPSCGRPLQVATVLLGEGFRWVAKPEPRIQSQLSGEAR
jgi:hypothetical protein